jgi:hypothetical protein
LAEVRLVEELMRPRGCVFIAPICAVLLAGCTNAAVDKAIGTTEGAKRLLVTRSDTAVVVDNAAGRPLLNIRATIEGDAGVTFVQVLPTLDTGQKADLRFGDFRTEDGTLFDPAVTRARRIKVAARDTLANNYDVVVPW